MSLILPPKEKIHLLWISDIHFDSKYTEAETELKSYINSFLALLEKEYSKIHYLILSGDIAKDGSAAAYKNFKNYFLQKITDKFKDIKVIPIPGNHDVDHHAVFGSWCSDDFTNNGKKRSENLKNNWEKTHLKVFKNYYEFFESNHLYDSTGRFEISESYKKYKTHGYLLDDDNKILFILINSAWYSLGYELDKILKEQRKDIYENPEKLINFKNNTVEFGNQYADNGLDEVLKKISDCPEYLKIVVQHHPQHWLNWEELYKEKNEEKETNTPLTNIYQKSHFLLTGHEHLPLTVKNDKLYEKTSTNIEEFETHHLKAGMFLSHKLEKDFVDKKANPLSNNRFSILSIDFERQGVTEERFYYDYVSGKYEWKKLKKGSDIYFFELSFKLITEIIFDKYKDKLKETELSLKYLFRKQRLPETTEYQKSDIFNFHLSADKVFVFPTIESFFSKENQDLLIKSVDIILVKNTEIEKVIFVVPDFLAYDIKEVKELYVGKKEDRNVIFFHSYCNAEMHFNVFRHYFFNRKGEVLNNINPKLSFILQLTPYWELL